MRIKKLAAAVLAAAVTTTSSAYAVSFTDIWGHWAEKIIISLADSGIINGITPTEFVPEGTVTRAEFLKMAMETSGIEPVDFREGECLDAVSGDWFCGYMQSALDKGLIPAEMIGGCVIRVVSETDEEGNVVSKAVYTGAFGGNTPITREEMAVITQNTYQYSLNANTMRDMNTDFETEFTDIADISEWALQSVKLACAQGFIEGMDDGSFAPTATATRAQSAAIISRVMDKVKKER